MDTKAKDSLKQSTAILSISVAILLFGVKAIVGVMTNSVGILASALDSLLDVFSSAINLWSIRTAAKPADREHPFGHGKAESLAAFFQSLVIFGSVIFLVVESIKRLVRGAPLEHLGYGIAVMAFSSVMTLVLIFRLRKVMKISGSLALKAEYLHYMPDLLANLAVLLGFAAMWAFGWTILDPLLSLGISVYLIFSAAELLKESVDVLMDKEISQEKRDRIDEIIHSFYPGVIAYHQLKTRGAGDTCFAELHVEICERQSFRQAHDISEDVVAELERQIEGLQVTIHADPCLNCRRCRALFESIHGTENGGAS